MADEVEELLVEIQELVEQIRELENLANNSIIVEALDTVPEFEHIAIGWGGEYPTGNFVYYRPIIWGSFQNEIPNVYGRYDHGLELLHLPDDIEGVFILMDDEIISIRKYLTRQDDAYADPLKTILNDPLLYPEFHNANIKPADEDELVTARGFSSPNMRLKYGFYPVTNHDIVVKVGKELWGIKFPENQRIEYARRVRIAVVSKDKISLHGYPESNTPDNLDYAKLAYTATDALGFLVLEEMMRTITMLSHEIEEKEGGNAPSAPRIQKMSEKMENILSRPSAKGKLLTTWAAIKSGR